MNNSILNNLNASDEMKKDILEACINNKRSSNLMFRYSKQMVAACAAILLAIGGTTVYAGISYHQRLEAMTKEEKQEYVRVNNAFDVGYSYSRDLSRDEHERMISLLDEYRNGRFPENSIVLVKTKAELVQDTLCCVEENNTVYLPETELTDEQLLEIIDYSEKVNYAIEEDCESNYEEYRQEEIEESKKIDHVGDMDAEEFHTKTKQFVQDYLGVTLDESYDAIVDDESVVYSQKDGDHCFSFYVTDESCYDFPEGKSKVAFEDVKTIAADYLKTDYDVTLPSTATCYVEYTNGFSKNAAGFYSCIFESDELATNVYQVEISCETGEPLMVSRGGSGNYSEDYTIDEIRQNADAILAIAEDYMKKRFPAAGELVSASYRPLCNEYDKTANTVIVALEYENGYYLVDVNPATKSVDNFMDLETKESLDYNMDVPDDVLPYTKIK